MQYSTTKKDAFPNPAPPAFKFPPPLWIPHSVPLLQLPHKHVLRSLVYLPCAVWILVPLLLTQLRPAVGILLVGQLVVLLLGLSMAD